MVTVKQINKLKFGPFKNICKVQFCKVHEDNYSLYFIYKPIFVVEITVILTAFIGMQLQFGTVFFVIQICNLKVKILLKSLT